MGRRMGFVAPLLASLFVTAGAFGCSSASDDIAELKQAKSTLQQQVKQLSADIVNIQQQQKGVKTIEARLAGVETDIETDAARQKQIEARLVATAQADTDRRKQLEARLAASEEQLNAVILQLGSVAIRAEKGGREKPPPARTKEFLMKAIEDDYKRAILSGELSKEDMAIVKTKRAYLSDQVSQGVDPRMSVDELARGRLIVTRIMTRYFPEFVPESPQ